MGNAKTEALDLFQQLPDDSSNEDIQHLFAFVQSWNVACPS
jgi:hypothetical protein